MTDRELSLLFLDGLDVRPLAADMINVRGQDWLTDDQLADIAREVGRRLNRGGPLTFAPINLGVAR